MNLQRPKKTFYVKSYTILLERSTTYIDCIYFIYQFCFGTDCSTPKLPWIAVPELYWAQIGTAIFQLSWFGRYKDAMPFLKALIQATCLVFYIVEFVCLTCIFSLGKLPHATFMGLTPIFTSGFAYRKKEYNKNDNRTRFWYCFHRTKGYTLFCVFYELCCNLFSLPHSDQLSLRSRFQMQMLSIETRGGQNLASHTNISGSVLRIHGRHTSRY